MKRRKENTKEVEDSIAQKGNLQKMLGKYISILDIYIDTVKLQEGKGIMKSEFYFCPQELLKRLELLNGSLAAGNKGVLTEYIQIAHRLRDLGVVTNNQLNTLLRKYIHF